MATCVSLNEAEADFELKMIRLKNKDQTNPESAAINPRQQVPFLVVDGKGLR